MADDNDKKIAADTTAKPVAKKTTVKKAATTPAAKKVTTKKVGSKKTTVKKATTKKAVSKTTAKPADVGPATPAAAAAPATSSTAAAPATPPTATEPSVEETIQQAPVATKQVVADPEPEPKSEPASDIPAVVKAGQPAIQSKASVAISEAPPTQGNDTMNEAVQEAAPPASKGLGLAGVMVIGLLVIAVVLYVRAISPVPDAPVTTPEAIGVVSESAPPANNDNTEMPVQLREAPASAIRQIIEVFAPEMLQEKAGN